MNDTRRPIVEETLPPLEAGDRLDQQTFHARYEAMPPATRAELIGRIVFIYGRTTARHARLLVALRDGYFVELDLGPDGILRSQVFPGLWLDPVALLQLDSHRVTEVLRQGLATPEHAAFVAKLAAGTGPSNS